MDDTNGLLSTRIDEIMNNMKTKNSGVFVYLWHCEEGVRFIA